MKKIICLLVVVAFMAAGAPVTYAEEDPMVNPPDEAGGQQEETLKTPSVYNEGFDTTGAAVFAAGLLGLTALMVSSDGVTGHDAGHSGHGE